MSLTIIKPGISTSIQDLGRWGYQAYGIPVGGAMDKEAASLANIICGNDKKEPVLEMTLHGTTILFNNEIYCSFTGGGCKACIKDIELPFNRLLHLPAGSVVQTKPDAIGCRSYLAVMGGLDVPAELGSASTHVPSGLGGIEGRNLIAGDVISFKHADQKIHSGSLQTLSENIRVAQWEVAQRSIEDNGPASIRVIAGPEWELFDESQWKTFNESLFTISSQSNRMGYRLQGQQIVLKKKFEMISSPVTAGIIQITYEGDPIILMADAQTTGGYPRIARVCSEDIPILAQCRPGSKVRFTSYAQS